MMIVDRHPYDDRFTITVRPDRLSPWFDVAFDGDHWASFKTLDAALSYIGEDADDEDDEMDRRDDDADSYAAPLPCGCTEYHMADCPIRTGG